MYKRQLIGRPVQGVVKVQQFLLAAKEHPENRILVLPVGVYLFIHSSLLSTQKGRAMQMAPACVHLVQERRQQLFVRTAAETFVSSAPAGFMCYSNWEIDNQHRVSEMNVRMNRQRIFRQKPNGFTEIICLEVL